MQRASHHQIHRIACQAVRGRAQGSHWSASRAARSRPSGGTAPPARDRARAQRRRRSDPDPVMRERRDGEPGLDRPQAVEAVARKNRHQGHGGRDDPHRGRIAFFFGSQSPPRRVAGRRTRSLSLVTRIPTADPPLRRSSSSHFTATQVQSDRCITLCETLPKSRPPISLSPRQPRKTISTFRAAETATISFAGCPSATSVVTCSTPASCARSAASR